MVPSLSTACDATAAGTLTRLAEHAALWLQRDACLAIRFPYTGCDHCARECPVDVLSLNGNGPELSGDCLNCGRCVAACPTDALRMPGSRLETPEPEKPVQLDCQRVPAALSPDNTLRPPCLGAVRMSELLALAQGGSSVTLLDRGWCGNCPAGGERHPAAAPVAETREWLRDAHPNAESAIRIESHPLPEEVALDAIPDPLVRRRTGRRGFLRQLAGEAVSTRLPHESSNVAPPHHGNRRIEPAERLARLAALPDEPPAALLPTLVPGDDCCNHNVCARLCPTGALQVYEDAGSTGIRFDARRCISCRACVAGCPERALGLTSEGGTATVVTLSHHRLRDCSECSRPFAAPDAEPDAGALPVCPACSKSRRLVRAGFDELFTGDRRC